MNLVIVVAAIVLILIEVLLHPFSVVGVMAIVVVVGFVAAMEHGLGVELLLEFLRYL